MGAKEHYDNHLAKFYSWMLGDFELKTNEQMSYFQSKGLAPKETGIAIDLGAGNGIQSIALARLGYTVIAIDFNQDLLNELHSHKASLAIETKVGEILDFNNLSPREVSLVCCMGDTLSHLKSLPEILQLIQDIHARLSKGGELVLSFRDYAIPLEGDARFVPVKSDETRVFTCFLEYSEQFVNVTDLLYERVGESWEQRISSYQKVRITEPMIVNMLEEVGFHIQARDTLQRMVHLVAVKGR